MESKLKFYGWSKGLTDSKFIEDFGLMALIKFVLAVFKIVEIEVKIGS